VRFRKLTEQEESSIEDAALDDRPYSYADFDPPVAHVVRFIKGKSHIHIARTFMDRKRNFVGQHFWARVVTSSQPLVEEP